MNLNSIIIYALMKEMSFPYEVRQVLTYVERGEVDAGFAYLTDTKAADPGRAAIVIVGNISISTPVTYSISVVSSKYTETSQKFFFVTGNDEQTISNKYGFFTQF